MSISFSAYIVFGVKADISILTQCVKERGCSHEETDKAFCAVCGAPMWKTINHRIYLDPHENSTEEISYYYSCDPDSFENEKIVIGFLVDVTNSISKFYELSKEQKEKYTQKLINWFNDYGIIFNIEPQMHLILHAS